MVVYVWILIMDWTHVLQLQLHETDNHENVYIEAAIVSQISTEISLSLKYHFHLILFHCCLSSELTRNNSKDHSANPPKFDFKARGGCLVTYAISRSYKSRQLQRRIMNIPSSSEFETSSAD